MPGRRNLPDIMGEALGRLRIATREEPAAMPHPSLQSAPSPPKLPSPLATRAVPEAIAPSDLRDKLLGLRLDGMAKALEEQDKTPEAANMSFEERLGRILDREAEERQRQRVARSLKRAGLRYAARLQDIDYSLPRGLDHRQVEELAQGDWIVEGRNLLLTGPVGSGKTFLACALGHSACMAGFSVLYERLPLVLSELAGAAARGAYKRLVNHYAKFDLLILDDWGLEPLSRRAALDMLELMEARYETKSSLLTSNLPVERWREVIADPNLAVAVVERLILNGQSLTMKGQSLRLKQA